MPTVRARRGSPFTAPERDLLLRRFRAGYEQTRRAELETHDQDAIDEGRRIMAAASKEYVDAVPIVRLSRSPVTAAVFESSLDIDGIDGLWWGYDYEYRPWVDPPAGFFAWTGALKIDGPLPEWSLKAMVGPEVPFVLPRILDHPAISAVVSTVMIGDHVGFPIVYYADPVPPDLERVDDWGHRSYTYLRPDGSPTSVHSTQDDAEKDFDLRPWLERGRLSWIEPGDLGLKLRDGADGCPYLDLPGERRRRYVEGDDTWFA